MMIYLICLNNLHRSVSYIWRRCCKVSCLVYEYMSPPTHNFSVLPPTTLAEILAPSSLMVNRKFELSVDQWRFVGHPFFVRNGTFSITFNVVFVVEVSFTTEMRLW